MEKRLDYGRVETWEKLDDGRLRVKASVSRVGTLDYRMPDGSTQREYLTADELFNPASLNTAGLAPVTLGHPDVGMVTSKNWRKYAVGATGSKIEARKNDGLVDIVFVVGDEEAIAAIEDGVREVSAGYTTELRTDGVRLYQTNRKYNHFALVRRGRAGETVRLHLDGAPDWGVQIVERTDEQDSERNPDTNQLTNDSPKETSTMAMYRGVEMSEDAMNVVKGMESEMESMRSDMEKMKKDMGSKAKKDEADAATVTQLTEARIKADARADAAEAKLTELQTQLENKMDSAQVESEIKARLDAWSQAMPFLGKDAKFDSSDSVLAIQCKAIAKQRPNLNLDELKGKYCENFPVYIQATFDSLEAPAAEEKQKPSEKSDAYDEAIRRAKVGGDRSGASLESREDEDEEKRLDAELEKARQMYETAWMGGAK